MSWNYRMVRYHDGSGYGIHEVFYRPDGTVEGWTKEPVTFSVDTDETPDDLRDSLRRALKDATEREIFDEPEPANA
jgi:hypothetical protein